MTPMAWQPRAGPASRKRRHIEFHARTRAGRLLLPGQLQEDHAVEQLRAERQHVHRHGRRDRQSRGAGCLGRDGPAVLHEHSGDGLIFANTFNTHLEIDAMFRRLSQLLAVLTLALLSACASSSGGLSTRDDDKRYINASLGSVNHTGQYLYGFYVNGQYGANASKYGGGNAGMCCVRLPRVWRPGLTVDIQYDLLINDGKDDNWKTKKGVPVEPYEKPGDMYVHFFPNDEIRVVVSLAGPSGSQHPIPYPVNPNKNRGGRQ